MQHNKVSRHLSVNMKKRFVCLSALIFIMAILVSGCANSISGNAYDVLYTGAVTYDTALSYAGDEYAAGRVSEDQKNQMIAYAKKLQLAMQTAQDALAVYRRAELLGQDLTEQEKALAVAMDVVETAQDVLTRYVQSLKTEEEI